MLRTGLESDAFSISLPTKFVYTFLVSARSLTENEGHEKKYHSGLFVGSKLLPPEHRCTGI